MTRLFLLGLVLLVSGCAAGPGLPRCCEVVEAERGSRGHENFDFYAVALSNDGTFLVATDSRCRGLSWRLENGDYQPLARRYPQDYPLYRCGSRIQVEIHGTVAIERHNEDGEVNLLAWDLTTGEVLHEWLGQMRTRQARFPAATAYRDRPEFWNSPRLRYVVERWGRDQYRLVDLLGDADPLDFSWTVQSPRALRRMEQTGEVWRHDSPPGGIERPVFSWDEGLVLLGPCYFEVATLEELYCRPYREDSFVRDGHTLLSLSPDGNEVFAQGGSRRSPHFDLYDFRSGEDVWSFTPESRPWLIDPADPEFRLWYDGGDEFVVTYCKGYGHELRSVETGELLAASSGYRDDCRYRPVPAGDGRLAVATDEGGGGARFYALYVNSAAQWMMGGAEGWSMSWTLDVSAQAGLVVLQNPLAVLDLETGREVARVVPHGAVR